MVQRVRHFSSEVPEIEEAGSSRPRSRSEAEGCARLAGEILRSGPLDRGQQILERPPSRPATGLQLDELQEALGVGIEGGGEERVWRGDLNSLTSESLAQVAAVVGEEVAGARSDRKRTDMMIIGIIGEGLDIHIPHPGDVRPAVGEIPR
jgi:hypothetical protein